jgi:RimJ/RimL family protein N-acetyltransferase
MLDVANYSVGETLRDGTPVEIRALKADDREALLAAVRGMSDKSLYRRFFTFKRMFSEQETSKFVDVDFHKHVALVAVTADGFREIVAGARYVVVTPGQAEVACAVTDKFQGRGLGHLLFFRLCAIAIEAGLQTFVAEVLPDNEAMLKVFRNSGFPVQLRRDYDAVHVVIELQPSHASADATGKRG